MNQKEWDRISKRLLPEGACLIWPGATGGGKTVRYPVGQVGGKLRSLHRAAYEFFHGDLPQGRKEVVEHTCHRSLCLNPDHLRRVTQRANLSHSPTTVNAINAAKTQCDSGHEFDVLNTYWTKNGQRACRKCKAAYARRVRAKKKENTP